MSNLEPLITVRDVTRSFGDDAGVFDLNFTVEPGLIFGLVGPSGSGKTTTVRLLTGLHRPDSGELRVFGQEPRAFTTAVRDQLAYMPQHFVLYPSLSVWENLNFMASIYGQPYTGRRRHLHDLLDFVDLGKARQRLARDLSGGMQRRLMLACALVNDPLLLFADEPTAGIDPVLRGRFWEHFRALRDAGRTLFVTTQYIGEVAYCDYVAVMREGRLLHLDTPTGLRRRALGGDVLRFQVEPALESVALRRLVSHDLVKEVRRARGQPGLLHVYTSEAGAVLPQLITLLGEEPAVPVLVAEEYLPPFDEIFVMLMEQSEARDGAAAAALLEEEVAR
jgi:ABC-2 type transport system ATP-binding protein